MKSFLNCLIVAILVTTLMPLSSCKKGPNDPFLSFRSRTGRLAGTWKLSKYTKLNTKIALNGTTTTTTTDQYDFDGTKVTWVNTVKVGNSTAIVNTSTYTYNEIWTVEKANTYTSAITFGNNTTNISGSWSWLNSDKAADLKNKEAVVLLPNTYSGAAAGSNGQLDDPHILVLDELKNTEIIAKVNTSSDDGNGNKNGVKTTSVATYTYNQ